MITTISHKPNTNTSMDNLRQVQDTIAILKEKRAHLKASNTPNINGFKDYKISNEVACLTRKINRLRKNITYYKRQLKGEI